MCDRAHFRRAIPLGAWGDDDGCYSWSADVVRARDVACGHPPPGADSRFEIAMASAPHVRKNPWVSQGQRICWTFREPTRGLEPRTPSLRVHGRVWVGVGRMRSSAGVTGDRRRFICPFSRPFGGMTLPSGFHYRFVPKWGNGQPSIARAPALFGVLGVPRAGLGIAAPATAFITQHVSLRSSGPLDREIIGLRFGDAPDGRRQIGGTPAGGDAGSTEAPREQPQPAASLLAGRGPGQPAHGDAAARSRSTPATGSPGPSSTRPAGADRAEPTPHRTQLVHAARRSRQDWRTDPDPSHLLSHASLNRQQICQ
jgi:hypothetical protein